jgi:ssDNA-binding Zn-finger/Zn-ribbon topoisomerase 1
MADKPTELRAGEACPQCGGPMMVDARFDPERKIQARQRNGQNPALAQQYAEKVRRKRDELGTIHTCASCGYHARLTTGEQGQGEQQQQPQR